MQCFVLATIGVIAWKDCLHSSPPSSTHTYPVFHPQPPRFIFPSPPPSPPPPPSSTPPPTPPRAPALDAVPTARQQCFSWKHGCIIQAGFSLPHGTSLPATSRYCRSVMIVEKARQRNHLQRVIVLMRFAQHAIMPEAQHKQFKCGPFCTDLHCASSCMCVFCVCTHLARTSSHG